MGKIFVSYSRRDQEQVDRIVQVMEESRMNVWIDRENIKAGKAWRVQIVEAIDTCDAFVLVLSGNSALSDNVRKEIDLAQDSGRVIFPVMLDPVRLPAEIRYQLAGLQFIDVQMLGFDEGIRQLISTLNEHLEKIEPQKTTVRQTELVIQGVDLASFGEEKKGQLLSFIAQLCNADQSNLSIANMTAGSVHVFVNMPATDAFTLKTMALNREKRFKQMGITSLRIIGDSRFVNIAMGVLTTTATIGLLNLLWLSLPSLFPSMFGVVAGKVIVAASVVTVTTLAGVAVSNADINIPLFEPTSTPTITIPITGDLSPTETLTPAPISTQPPTLSQEEPVPPTETMTASPTSTLTLTLTFTPSPTLTPSATDTDTPTSTFTFTPTPTLTPSETVTASPTYTQASIIPFSYYIRGSGDYSCPGGYTLATYSNAINDTSLVCSALDTWDIARLADGGSFDGPGYGCGFRSFDDRSLGHSVCKPGSPDPVFVRGIGDNSCPVGYVLATYADATDFVDQICSVLDTWDIARLEGGGSFDGSGYGCGFRDFDERSLGHSVCKLGP